MTEKGGHVFVSQMREFRPNSTGPWPPRLPTPPPPHTHTHARTHTHAVVCAAGAPVGQFWREEYTETEDG
jgi:hypothetical protein